MRSGYPLSRAEPALDFTKGRMLVRLATIMFENILCVPSGRELFLLYVSGKIQMSYLLIYIPIRSSH